MFEKRYDPLISTYKFFIRLMLSIGISWLIIAIALGIGMVGYHSFENMTWIDAFANAAMILSGMGPLSQLATNDGKLFAGFYALFSGLMFIVIMGLIFAPILHRLMHKFHLNAEENLKHGWK